VCSVSWPHAVPFPSTLTSTRRTVCRSLTSPLQQQHQSTNPPPPSPQHCRQPVLKYSSTETSQRIPPALQPPSISIILQLAIQAVSNSTNRLHKCYNLHSRSGRSMFSSTLIVSVMQPGMNALLEHCCSRIPLRLFITVSLWENDTSSAALRHE
jgi:hypothetical protein